MVTPALQYIENMSDALMPVIIGSEFETDKPGDVIKSAHWYIATDASFRIPIFLEITGADNYNKTCPIAPLRYDITYYVRVKYTSKYGDTCMSDILVFKIKNKELS